MKNSSIFVAALALSAVNFSVSANQDTSSNTGPFSVTAGLGVAQHTIDSSGGYEDESGNATAFSLGLNYEFTPNLSATAAYINYGEARLFSMTQSNYDENIGNYNLKATLHSKTAGIAAYGTYHSTREVGNWSFGASLGLISWATELESDVVVPSLNISEKDIVSDENGVSIYGGVNATYHVTENFDLAIQGTWFVNDLDVDLIDNETVDMQHAFYGFTASYRF